MTIALVIPAYNEELAIAATMERLNGFCGQNNSESWRVVIVDDGSRDATTRRILEAAGYDVDVTLISLTRNFGQQAALLAGLSSVESDAYVMLDADLQDPLEVVLQMLSVWREEDVESVRAVRRKRAGETPLKRLSAFLFYRVFASLVTFRYPEDTGDFRLISRRLRDEVLKLGKSDIVLRSAIPWIGLPEAEVAYDRPARVLGQTKYGLRSQARLALEAIVSFSKKPLDWIGVTAILLSVATSGYLIWIIQRALSASETVEGWASTIGVVLALGSFQLVAIGTIAVYVGRLLTLGGPQPVYVVRKIVHLGSKGNEE